MDLHYSKLERYKYLLSKGRLFNDLIVYFKRKFQKREEKILPPVTIEKITAKSVKPAIIASPNATLDGNVSPLELQYLSRVVKHFKPKNLFEIGTFDGRTTLHLAANAPDNAKVYTLDLPPAKVNETEFRIKTSDAAFILKEQSGREFLKRPKENKKITQLYGDSATFDYGPYENKMDFIFVDGSHSYEYVISDTLTALKLLRKNKGVIMWHDYSWPEVVLALNEFYRSHEILKNMQHISDTTLAFLHVK